MKFKAYTKALDKISSHPARGAWIEIGAVAPGRRARAVAPRKGRVD